LIEKGKKLVCEGKRTKKQQRRAKKHFFFKRKSKEASTRLSAIVRKPEVMQMPCIEEKKESKQRKRQAFGRENDSAT